MKPITRLRHRLRWYDIVSVETVRGVWPEKAYITEIVARRKNQTIRRVLRGHAVADQYAAEGEGPRNE